MSEWKVYNKDGITEVCSVKALEYSGSWMGECSVTATITSPTPLSFSIGDYLEYRGERFEINYDPTVIKSATSGSYGEGFTYDNVKFNSLSDELTRCDFLDFVPSDNQIHYSSLPNFSFFADDVRKLAERIQVNLDRIYKGNKKWTVIVSDEYNGKKDVNIAVNNITCWEALALVKSQFGANFIIKNRTIIIGTEGLAVGKLFSYGKGNGLVTIERSAESNQKIITRLRAYGSTRNLPNRYYFNTGLVPNNLAVQNLMLPSFPNQTLDPYIDSENISELGVREGTVFFDGSGDLEEIYPSMEGMTAEQLKEYGVSVSATGRLDEVIGAEQITDNGIIEPSEDENAIIAPFTITLKDIGFDINDYLSTAGSATISMKDGMCGGRDFEIVECVKEGNNYILTCNRSEDTSLGLFFPYSDYQIKSGDRFVLLNIEMPDVYIKAASQRLLNAAKDYLAQNDYVRYSYTPKVDNIFMARQHDEAIQYGEKSLHDTIKEGDLMLFEDDDLRIEGSVIISTLSIKEGEGRIPQYEITLNNEKAVGTFDKIQNQIDAIVSGSTSVKGGGGYNSSQINSMIEVYGSKKFLRKDKDDRSKGKISSDKGFEVGNYIQGMIGGQGGYYYKDENGKVILELDKIHAREELIVPKISFNCIDVVTGELAQTFAYGTIKSVDVENQIATLDLLGDEYGTLHEDDICRGIFHFLNEENNSEYEVDHNKFHNYSGFSTSYFTPTEIIASDKGVMKFRYELQEGTTVHPTIGMNFFAYGNFSDTNRQSVTYQTRDYTRRLVNVDDWTINPDKNIAMQEGLLEGLTIGGMVMHGYGTFESNSYFTGAQIQFSPEQLEALRGESAIVMDLSNDTISIACDKDGVPTETVSSGSPKTTTLKVYYGLVRKELASLSASSHTGITISTDYTTGIVKVTGITSSAADSTEVTLTAEVEINGEYKEVSKVFTINKIKQGQTGQTGQTGGKGDAAVVYSIQPNNLPLSLVGGVVTPSTATFTCYKNTGMSTQETETAYWYAYRCNTGNERDYVLFASKESYVSSYNVTFSPSYKFYKIVAKPYGGVQTTAYAMYTQDGEGSPGENGYFPRDRGLFVSGERYYYSKDSSTGDIYRDKVVYEIEGTYYNFLVKSRNDNGYITAAPTSATGDSNWEVISQYRALIADTLFGSNANIGGFMASAEKLRTSSEVDGKPRFEIDGSQGTQTMRQDGGTVWAVNADGVQSIGFEDGERIVLDPNDKSISVFDSNGVQRTNIDGKEYTKSELIVSSGGTFSLSSYASNSSGRSLTSSNALGSVGSYSLTSVLTFRYAGVAEVNISNFYMSLYHSARATSTVTPSVIPNGKAYIYLCTYTSSSATTLVSKRLVAYRNVSDATVDGSTTTTDRLSGTFSVSVPSGYHRIEVLMEVTNGSSIGSTTITAYWSLSSAKIVVESYMSRLFANGMMLSKSSDEYFMAMMDGDQMNVEAVTGSSGIRLNNGAIQLKYNNSGWFNMPITLLFARVTVSSGATSGASISYNSYDGSTVSVSSSTEGIFNITIPSSWGVTASNTNIQATAFYRYRGNSTNAVCWAVVNSVSSTSIQVITSYNNNNEFDHSGFYLEVKKFQ